MPIQQAIKEALAAETLRKYVAPYETRIVITPKK